MASIELFFPILKSIRCLLLRKLKNSERNKVTSEKSSKTSIFGSPLVYVVSAIKGVIQLRLLASDSKSVEDKLRLKLHGPVIQTKSNLGFSSLPFMLQ